MNLAPSPQQLQVFQDGKAGPLVLFYEFSCADPAKAAGCLKSLAAHAAKYGGLLRWAGEEQELLAGRIPRFHQAASLHFRSREEAQLFIESVGHRTALPCVTTLQVAVLGEQPRIVGLMSAVLAKLLPHWPFDNSLEDGEEPGVGTSTVMPTAAAIAAVRGHPQQDTPVTMINWLKFKPVASNGAAVSGKTAYHRYGKVALTTTHSLGAKLIFAARYRQILIGREGDPGVGLWDEFALMQYPGRATFGRMAQLRRYRRALADREAGLAEYGQGLTVSRPQPEFTWRP